MTLAASGASDIVARVISEPLANGYTLMPGAAAAPGYNFASGVPGSIGNIVGEMVKDAMKIRMAQVPYRGGAPMTTDLIAGVIPVGIDVITASVPIVRTGAIKAP